LTELFLGLYIMGNNEHYAADKPVSVEKEDRFQRYTFSKRIADTIINRKDDESIVFGLFGAWGEGKSSVLNFIEQELTKDDTIISIRFNPWRFSDEDKLLKSFFTTIAHALGKELDSKKEKFAGFVAKYAASTKILGVDIASVGKAFADVGIEEFKDRIDEFLGETSNKLVVFIDDIDRLDKQEIYTLFRLVKLIADFPNTTYILSFDEAMVAAAIGERFGAGDQKSGESFLEKIIQVPLNIPKAQPGALQKFCFDLVNNAFSVNNIDLDKNDSKTFVEQFTTHVLPRLTTPRLAIRYGNTLSFSIPLLNGEVNMVDLMLIEAIKVFYPKHYQFIKQNPDYFIGSYHLYEHTNDEGKIAAFNGYLNTLNKDLSPAERIHVIDLLTYLFPTLNSLYEHYEISGKSRNKWYSGKRITSTEYFDRYFSYAVIEGDISDIEFDRLIKNTSQKNVDELSEEMKSIISKTDASNFITKLRSKETELEWPAAKALAQAICQISDLLPHEHGSLFIGYESTRGQAALFIYQLLKNHKEKKQDIFEFAKELMTFPPDTKFSYTINNWLRTGEQPEDKLFSNKQYIELAEIFTDRVLKENGDKSIFETFADTSPDKIHLLVYTMSSRNQDDFHTYTANYLNEDQRNVLTLIKSFIPMGRSNIREGEYKSDINKNVYDHIVHYFDKDDLYNRIVKNFSIEEIEKEQPFQIDFGENEFTELNMVRQFFRFYKKDKEGVVS
jgi:predicted KAP-like P-loop ATPase